MALTLGSRLGPYEITALIGIGGMGEVYRAADTNLKRQVAIKVLPASVAGDAERLARFRREAEVLAALNHPNIAQVHGLEKSDGTIALVMELVEGPTLADWIASRVGLHPRPGPPLDESLAIAKQIADALEAAHEQGIVHRDLKPANVKVRIDGTVKVLDFGLAKATDPAHAPLSEAPTLTSPAVMTGAGMILGTAAYMSPEQARGSAVDRRADLWAFGVVLWEMLTGVRLFDGATVSDTLAAVLRAEPDWSALPATTPAPIRRLLRRCLERDRKRRLDSAAVARLDIEEAMTASPTGEAAVTPVTTRPARAWLASAVAGGFALAFVTALVAWAPWRPTPPPPETRTEIVTPATGDPTEFALSPDGRHLVFVAFGEGPSRLWLRPLSGTEARVLPGTEDARRPFWSPDGRSVAFYARNKLMRLDIGGSQPRAIADSSVITGGTWGLGDVVLFTAATRPGVSRVSAAGGPVSQVTSLRGAVRHEAPKFLPDGRRFLFFVNGTAVTNADATDAPGIYLGSLDTSEARRLTAADGPGVYMASGPALDDTSGGDGWLLFARDRVLLGRRLDLDARTLTGDPITIATDFTGEISASATGVIAYRRAAPSARQLTWFDASGAVVGVFGPPTNINSPRLSPDDRRVVFWQTLQGNGDIWLMDGLRSSRFTVDAANDIFPVWSPDGRWVVFAKARGGTRILARKLSSGAGDDEALLQVPENVIALSVSPNSRFLLYRTTGNDDLWALPLGTGRKPFPVVEGPAREANGGFSPDGRWVAYTSDESGRVEIYVRPFVDPTSTTSAAGTSSARWQVSTSGGIAPAWRSDGRELYYIDPDGRMMAVTLAIATSTVEPGPPRVLFQTRIVAGGSDNGQGRQYDVARDGRFLINTVLGDTTPITLLMNWQPDAK